MSLDFVNGTVDAANADAAVRDKEIATLAAECALAGFSLFVTAAFRGSTSFLVTRWGRSIEFATTDGLRDWLERAVGSVP